MQIIVLFGLPGSGKGTQARMFKDQIEICSIGEVLRKKSKTDLEIAKALSTGALLSGNIATTIVLEHLNSCITKSDIVIIDGYPRSLDQLFALKSWCDQTNINVYVIYLDISIEEAIKRLLNRVLCAQCDYPMIKGQNDQCKCCMSKDLYVRADDNINTINNRLAIYLASVQDMLDQYKELAKEIYRIDGTRSPELVYEEICCIIRNIGVVQ